MKMLLTADIHLKLKQDKRYKRDLVTTLKFLADTVEEEQPDIFIIAGDIFDTKYPTATEYALFTAFINRLSVQTIIFPGNHDTPNNSEEANTLKQFFNLKIPNLSVFHKPGIYTVKGIDFLIIPYIHHNREEVLTEVKRLHDEYTGKELILLGHFWVDSYKVDNRDYSQNIHEFIVTEAYLRALTKVKYYMLGHIHIGGQVFPNCNYPGAPFRTSLNEKEDKKFILRYDDQGITKIETPAIPITSIYISTPEQLNQDFSGIKERICQLSVSNLEMDFMAKINLLKKQLEDQGNYVYTSIDLKSVKFQSVQSSKPTAMSDFFENYIKMNNLKDSELVFKQILQDVINGSITDKSNFFDIKSLAIK